MSSNFIEGSGEDSPMSNDAGKKWVELAEKRESLEGTKILRMLQHLAASHYAVNRNYLELVAAIDKYEKDLSIWEVTKRRQLDAFMREVLRLLQNYLSSIYSLIQRTKVFCRDLKCAELDGEYSSKLDELLKQKCVWFVKDLRTFSQHLMLPFVSASLSFTKDTKTDGGVIDQKMLLQKKELLKWENWSKNSKEYINSLEKDIEIKTVVLEFQRLISNFYEWFYKKVVALYSDKLEELMRLESEMARLE